MLGSRFKNAWDAFNGRAPTYSYAQGSYSDPGRIRLNILNERSFITSVYNQIAVDCSSIDIRHVMVDGQGRYKKNVEDSLNRVLTETANLDQTGRFFIRDAVLTLLDEGCVALVPFLTDKDPLLTDSYEVLSARVGRIRQWFPSEILVEVYNENSGKKEYLKLPKRICPIIENPFYSIMNERNSTAQRLLRVLSQCDRTNEQNSAGKMDIIIQLPYLTRSKAKQELAENRRRKLEAQLTHSQYGIGYIDGTEKVIQLNRSLENNLWAQAKDLKMELMNQLGMSMAIFDGTADEQTMLNYQNRTLEPILTAIVEEIERKWLSPTAITQGHAIRYFKNPFKLVPISQLAELADKFTRNCIMTSNELRSIIGFQPIDDPKADQLINNNLNQPEE